MGNGTRMQLVTKGQPYGGKGEPDWKARLAQRNKDKLKLMAKLKKQARQV